MKQEMTHVVTQTAKVFFAVVFVFGSFVPLASAQYYDGGYNSWGGDSGYNSWGGDSGYNSWGSDSGYNSWGGDSYGGYQSQYTDLGYDSYGSYGGYSGGYSGGYFSGSLFNYNSPDYPVCKSFSSNKTTLPAGGGNVTLSWDTKHADVVSITGIGSVTKDGSKTLYVDDSQTFTLVAQGDGYTIACHTSVHVAEDTTSHVIDAYISASPTIIEAGSSTVLTWGSTNATVCRSTASPLTTGGAVSGSKSVTLNNPQTKVFSIECENTSGDTATAYTTVQVVATTPGTPSTDMPQCNTFYANPSVLSNGGGTTTLVWETTNASTVSINNGIGAVSLDGSRSVTLSNTETFTLTAQNSAGDSVTCTESVAVLDDVPSYDSDLSCDSFYATPTHLDDGDDFRLYWHTTGADQVYINNGVGYVSEDGYISLEADRNEEHYILTAQDGTNQVTCHEYIQVDDDDYGDRPRCDLDASDDDIDEGDRVRLSWDNQRADDIRLRDDNGEEYFDTRHSSRDRRDYDEDDDSIYVYPDEDTRYTLTVYNDEGSRTCSVSIDVDGNGGSVASANITRLPGQVAGIAVSNVPYTGFEAGPLLTSIFYTILALWGAGIAYLLVVHKRRPVSEAVVASAPTVPVVTAEVPVHAEVPVAEEERRSSLRTRAEEERILLAPDAVAFIKEQAETESDQFYLFNKIVELAKATFPMEDGWIALDRKRIESIIEDA